MSYRVTEESTGELLAEFQPADFDKGANGALYAAARYATRQAKDEGRAVLLSGADGLTRRRYAPEYQTGHGNRPYRVPCTAPACSRWVHPVNPRSAPLCREHFRQAPETAARGERLTQARLRKREE